MEGNAAVNRDAYRLLSSTVVRYDRVEMRRTLPRGVVLLLALWGALIPAVLAAPATASSVGVIMAGGSGHGECDVGRDGKADRKVCELVCLIAAQVATTLEAWSPDTAPRQGRELEWRAALSDRFLPPDPAPPRASRLF